MLDKVEVGVEVFQRDFQRVRAHEIHQSDVVHGDAEWIEFGVDFQVWDSEGGRAGIVRLNHLQSVAVLFCGRSSAFTSAEQGCHGEGCRTPKDPLNPGHASKIRAASASQGRLS